MSDHDEAPDLTDEDFARAKPFVEMFPAQHQSWKRHGPPPVAEPKVHVGFRLAADVVEGINAARQGHNTRVEKVPRAALANASCEGGVNH